MTVKQDQALIQDIPEAYRDQAKQMMFRLNNLGANLAQKRMAMDSVQDMIRSYGDSSSGALENLYSLLSNDRFSLGMIGTVRMIAKQGGRTSSSAISNLESIISNDKYRSNMFTTISLVTKTSGRDVASALSSLDSIFRDHKVSIHVLEAARLGSYYAKEESGEALMCLHHLLSNPGFEKLNWAFPDMFGRFVSSAVRNAPDVEHISLRALSSLFTNSGFTSSMFTRGTAERFGSRVSAIISKTSKLGVYDSLDLFSTMLTNPNMVSMDEKMVGIVASLMETAVASGRGMVPTKRYSAIAPHSYLRGGITAYPPTEYNVPEKHSDTAEKPFSHSALEEQLKKSPKKPKKPLPVGSDYYEATIARLRTIVGNPHLRIEDFDGEKGFLGIVVIKPKDSGILWELGVGEKLKLLSSIIGPKTSKDTVDVMRGVTEGGNAPREWLRCFSAIIGNTNFRLESRRKGFAKEILGLLELVGKSSGQNGLLALERLFKQENFTPKIFSLIGPMAKETGDRTRSALTILSHYLESQKYSAKSVDAAFLERLGGIVKATRTGMALLENDFRDIFSAKNFSTSMLRKNGIISIMIEKGVGLGNLAAILNSERYGRSVLGLAKSIARDSEYPDEGFFLLVTSLSGGRTSALSERMLSQINHFIATGRLDPTFGLAVFKAVTGNPHRDFNKAAGDSAAMARLAKALGALQRKGMTLEGLTTISGILNELPDPALLGRVIPMLSRIAQRSGRQSDYVLRFLARNFNPATLEEDIGMLEDNLDNICDIVNLIAAHTGSRSEALEMFTRVDIFAVGKRYFESLTFGEKLRLATMSRADGVKMITEFIDAMADGAGNRKDEVFSYIFFNINTALIRLPKSADEARRLGRQVRRKRFP